MARIEKFRILHSRKVELTHRLLSEAKAAGAILNRQGGANGRHLSMDGGTLRNFGTCSYMGLETRPELREMAHQAIDRYGTQFQISRVYLECPLYQELEELLERITGRPVLVAPSTTLAHMSALPALIDERDSVLIDQFAHASLHSALELLPSVPREIVRHNRFDLIDAFLTRTAGERGRVWYVADGLYSMLGDFCDFAALDELFTRHPRLHAYIDDAHATGWFGKHGRGAALERLQEEGRVIVALSLNKSFSAAGGALVLPNETLKTRIRFCGGTLIFSGPIQPPMLGAAVGSARLHLSPELEVLQAELLERIAIAKAAVERAGLPVSSAASSPIFQVACDSPRAAFAVCNRLKQRGFYACATTFPAVPVNRPGVRFTISRHNAVEDIEPFVLALAESLRETEEETSRESAASGVQAAVGG